MINDNQCYITGNLGRDPEMKYTQSGRPYCRFSVASSYKTSGSEEHTDWVPIQVWGPLAESCGNNLRKGARVTVRGRFTTSSWKDSSGNKKYFTQLVADQVAMVLPSSVNANAGSTGGQSNQWGAPARQQGQTGGRGDFGQFGEARQEPPPMEQTSFSDYSSKQGEQVPPPKDEDLSL